MRSCQFDFQTMIRFRKTHINSLLSRMGTCVSEKILIAMVECQLPSLFCSKIVQFYPRFSTQSSKIYGGAKMYIFSSDVFIRIAFEFLKLHIRKNKNFTLGKTKKRCSRGTLSLHFFRDEFWWKANSGWKFIGLVWCWCVDTSLFMFSLLSYMRTRKPRPKRRYFYDLNFLLHCKPQSSRLGDFPICNVH